MECVKEQKEMLKQIIHSLEYGDEREEAIALGQLKTFETMLEVRK